MKVITIAEGHAFLDRFRVWGDVRSEIKRGALEKKACILPPDKRRGERKSSGKLPPYQGCKGDRFY